MNGPDVARAVQPRAMRSIDRLLAEGRAHAFLLSGTPGCGSHAAAQYIAAGVLCPAGGGDGCDVCMRVERRVHPDLIWVEPEGTGIRIDQVRAVIDTVSRAPFEGVAQVVVIDAAESLSSGAGEAGNSLLKVLEEPSGRVVFVLLVERSANVMQTIRSRVIEIPLPPISDPLLTQALHAAGVDETKLAAATGLGMQQLVRAARGDLHRALEIAAGDAAAQRRGELLRLMDSVAAQAAVPGELAGRIIGRAEAASTAATQQAEAEFAAMLELLSAAEQRSLRAKSNDQGIERRTRRRARRARVDELRACMDELAAWWRDVCALHAGAVNAVSNLDRLAQLQQVAAGPAGPRAVPALDAIDEAAAWIQLNNADESVVIGALAAELAALAAGRIRARRSIGARARTSQGYELALG